MSFYKGDKIMSAHNDVHLNIVCSNNEDAAKLASYLNENYDNDGEIQFQTNCFTISSEDGVIPNGNEIWIGYETGYREIGPENIYEFFAELDEIAELVGVSIINVRLVFVSQEGNESIIFVKKLSNTAFDKFISEYMETCLVADDEDPKETEAKVRAEYESKIWIIVCDEDSGSYDDEFANEFDKCARNIIDEWEFSCDEDFGMWIAALSEDGNILWDNR